MIRLGRILLEMVERDTVWDKILKFRIDQKFVETSCLK